MRHSQPPEEHDEGLWTSFDNFAGGPENESVWMEPIYMSSASLKSTMTRVAKRCRGSDGRSVASCSCVSRFSMPRSSSCSVICRCFRLHAITEVIERVCRWRLAQQ